MSSQPSEGEASGRRFLPVMPAGSMVVPRWRWTCFTGELDGGTASAVLAATSGVDDVPIGVRLQFFRRIGG